MVSPPLPSDSPILVGSVDFARMYQPKLEELAQAGGGDGGTGSN